MKSRRPGYLAIPTGIIAFVSAMVIILTGRCFDGAAGTGICMMDICWMSLLMIINI